MPGYLQELVAFDAPAISPDGSGGVEQGWTELFQARAEFIYSRGSEAVDAARLQGRAIYKVKLRSSTQARGLTTDYRMRDVRRNTAYQIREADAITYRAWVYLIVESGVAV